MSFAASKIFWWVASPGNLLAIVFGLGLLLLLLRRRGGTALVGIGVAAMLAVTLLPVRDWVLRPLENRFPAPVLPATIDGIIVLGGAIDPVLSADRGQPVLTDSAERMVAFAGLAR